MVCRFCLRGSGSNRGKSNEPSLTWLFTQGAVSAPRFTDPRLCSAIVDRLTFAGNIIETGTDSYRLAQTRARAEQAS
ncbi:hypothetical protein GCM10020216_034700 [Nonomuraea helvata]